MSVVEELRQNDPAKTRIRIRLFYETSDADLAQALEQNPFVTEIELDLHSNDEQQRGGDWNSLLRVIAMRANPEKVALFDGSGQRNAPAGLVRAFLRAIQQNTSIQSVHLHWLHLPTYIATFVDTASSITMFSICNCDGEQGTRDLAAALERNTNIQTLKLHTLQHFYTTAILESLRSNSSIKTLVVGSLRVEALHAMHQLLESTTSIKRFEFVHTNFTNETMFSPIFQAFTSSECVSELRFVYCTFYNQSVSAGALLQNILRNKRNLTSLCLQHCTFNDREAIHGAIISTLSRPDSVLRCFEVQGLFNFEGGLTTLLRAIESSKVERLTIGPFETRQQLQTLTQCIPSLRIRELQLQITVRHLDVETAKQDLLLAVKNNFRLRLVKGEIEDDGSDLFESARDKQRLAFYTNRNECLDQWVDNPERADRKVWPDALALAEKAGPDSLFRGLRSVLGSDSASKPNGRKRKRPQYYTP